MLQRPTGIIRTLPYFGGVEKGEDTATMMKRAYKRMMQSLKNLETDNSAVVYIALSSKPKIEVLHCYLLVGGQIRVRANIAGYEPGDKVGVVRCWDDSIRNPKWWAVLTAPVSFPEQPIPRRGFQGFRYTEDLW